MRKFAIVTDSCSEFDKPLREKYGVDYIPMHINYEDKEHIACLDWSIISYKDFYDMLRNKIRVKTAQITALEYKNAFKKYLDEGYDILSLSCSSALSASVKASYVAREELLTDYPDAKIYCIDTVNACMGLGLLCISASQMREEGKTIDEVASWIEEKKKTVNQECTVESLQYLKQAGRVSAASAFFGGLLSVKPIIISDVHGQNTAVEKVKGRATSFNRLIERFKEEYEDVPYQNIYVVHGDCPEDAEKLKGMIQEFLPGKEVNIHPLGPIIGATTGPGTVAIYFYGKKVTFDHKAN